MIEDIKSQVQEAIKELLSVAQLNRNDLFVLGMSASEIRGEHIGKGSNQEIGEAVVREIMDQLEEKGIIGPQDGAKKREVRINKQQWLEMQNQGPAPKMNAETAEQMRFEEAEPDEDQTDAE